MPGRTGFCYLLVLETTGQSRPQVLLHLPQVPPRLQGKGRQTPPPGPGEPVRARGGPSYRAEGCLHLSALPQPCSLLLWRPQGRKARAGQTEGQEHYD